MKEQDLNLENKAIITMAQYKEYEELKQNIGSIRISIGKCYAGYDYETRYFKLLSLETNNIPNEILEELESKVTEINKSLLKNVELEIELNNQKSMYLALNNKLQLIQSRWWYKLFNKE